MAFQVTALASADFTQSGLQKQVQQLCVQACVWAEGSSRSWTGRQPPGRISSQGSDAEKLASSFDEKRPVLSDSRPQLHHALEHQAPPSLLLFKKLKSIEKLIARPESFDSPRTLRIMRTSSALCTKLANT